MINIFRKATKDEREKARDILILFKKKFSRKLTADIIGINEHQVSCILNRSTCLTAKYNKTYSATSKSVLLVIDWWEKTGGVITKDINGIKNRYVAHYCR